MANPEVIAIDQDEWGIAGDRIYNMSTGAQVRADERCYKFVRIQLFGLKKTSNFNVNKCYTIEYGHPLGFFLPVLSNKMSLVYLAIGLTDLLCSLTSIATSGAL